MITTAGASRCEAHLARWHGPCYDAGQCCRRDLTSAGAEKVEGTPTSIIADRWQCSRIGVGRRRLHKAKAVSTPQPCRKQLRPENGSRTLSIYGLEVIGQAVRYSGQRRRALRAAQAFQCCARDVAFATEGQYLHEATQAASIGVLHLPSHCEERDAAQDRRRGVGMHRRRESVDEELWQLHRGLGCSRGPRMLQRLCRCGPVARSLPQ
mmetsp:Transcript_110581/g.247123  ORF Transcript_110581/g.247123 Transcript_110581/m.247123 type:complete len:209 (-) Transcript_110581:378-1004(-)